MRICIQSCRHDELPYLCFASCWDSCTAMRKNLSERIDPSRLKNQKRRNGDDRVTQRNLQITEPSELIRGRCDFDVRTAGAVGFRPSESPHLFFGESRLGRLLSLYISNLLRFLR